MAKEISRPVVEPKPIAGGGVPGPESISIVVAQVSGHVVNRSNSAHFIAYRDEGLMISPHQSIQNIVLADLVIPQESKQFVIFIQK